MASFVRSAFLIAVVSTAAAAQQPRRVSGVVERIEEDTTRPLAAAWVVLHRVGRTAAGPIDSVKSDPQGRYRFTYRVTPDSAVYFASSTYSGVAYFTPPFRTGDVTGDDATIAVFDTSSTQVSPTLRSHHVVVFSSLDNKVRRVSEVYWLENTSVMTRVSTGRSSSWSTALPAAAVDPRIDGGNISADAVRFGKGIMEVYAPLSPGLHQIHVSYDVPVKSFPLKLPVKDASDVFEVMIEDAGGSVRDQRFEAQEAVTVEGRSFRRLLGHTIAAGSTVEIVVPRAGRISGRTLYIMVVLGAAGTALLFGLTRTQSRPRPLPSVTRPTPAAADQLAHEIARLDEQFAKRKNPGDADREQYMARRAELNAQLTAVLEARDDMIGT